MSARPEEKAILEMLAKLDRKVTADLKAIRAIQEDRAKVKGAKP